MKYCNKCGKELKDDVYFCVACGNKVNGDLRHQDFYKKKKEKDIPNIIDNNDDNKKETPKPSKEIIKGGFLGFIITLLFSIIGLIVCLIFGDGSAKRGASIGFVISIILIVILLLLI